MALPIAHAAVGYLVHRLEQRRTGLGGHGRAIAFMTIANFPDADFALGFVIGQPGAFHRGLSHTLLAALVFGAALATLGRWRFHDGWVSASLLFASVYASHLVVDAFTIDERGAAGAQFFWPLSDAYYIAPVTLFGEIIVDGSSRSGFLNTVFTWQAARVLARDAVLAVLALGVFNLAGTLAGGALVGEAVRAELGGGAEEEDLA